MGGANGSAHRSFCSVQAWKLEFRFQQPCKVMLGIPATPALRSKESRDRKDPWDCVADTLTEKLVAADSQEQVKSDRRVPDALFCSTHTHSHKLHTLTLCTHAHGFKK